MIRFRFLFFGAWLMAWLSIPQLQAQESLSLSEAIEKSLANNYQVKIAKLDAEVAQNNNDWAIAGRYPTIDFTLGVNNSYNWQKNPASFFTQLSTGSSSLAPGINANWVLFDGYRIRFTKEQLEESQRLNEGNVKVAIENSVEEVILAYYAALIQKEQLAVLEEVLELSRDRIEYQEVRQEFGQAVSFDILQTQDAYFNDSTNYLIQENNYKNALRSLNRAMGEKDLSKVFTLTDQLDFPVEKYDLEALQTRMLANNQNLKNLAINRELSNINTRIQESGNYPRISLGAGGTFNQNFNLFGSGTALDGTDFELGGINTQSFNGFINLNASYNLFDGGVRRKNIENAKTNELVAQLNVENLKENLQLQLESTLATYNNEKELVILTDQLIKNAQENLAIAEERFKGGVINSFDYRSIQLSYINASQSRLSAIFNLLSTETQLVKLIGGLVR